jgi:hypothetical protein
MKKYPRRRSLEQATRKKRKRNKLKRDFKCHKTPVVQRQQLLTRSLSLSLYLLETHYNYYNHCCCFAAAAAASRSTRKQKKLAATSKDGGRRQKTTDDDDNAVRTRGRNETGISFLCDRWPNVFLKSEKKPDRSEKNNFLVNFFYPGGIITLGLIF